jgi:hypothetical protein
MTGIQTIHSGSEEALFPSADGRRCCPQPLLDGVERGVLGQHQDQPGAEDISGRQRAGLGDAAEFPLLAVGKNYRIPDHT